MVIRQEKLLYHRSCYREWERQQRAFAAEFGREYVPEEVERKVCTKTS